MKSVFVEQPAATIRSLPSWERGLKYQYWRTFSRSAWSLPSWERGLKFPPPKNSYLTKHVAPLVGAWIEIYNHFELIDEKAVAPLVGAWIEIGIKDGLDDYESVAPLVGAWIEIEICGMGYRKALVAPLVGAWIEICYGWNFCRFVCVAPLVGAWIEITNVPIVGRTTSSLPSWERGLKYALAFQFVQRLCRSPRGSVD